MTTIIKTSTSVLEELKSLERMLSAARQTEHVGQGTAGCRVKDTKDMNVFPNMCVLEKMFEPAYSLKHTSRKVYAVCSYSSVCPIGLLWLLCDEKGQSYS